MTGLLNKWSIPSNNWTGLVNVHLCTYRTYMYVCTRVHIEYYKHVCMYTDSYHLLTNIRTFISSVIFRNVLSTSPMDSWGTFAGDPWLFLSTALSVVVNDGVSVKWPSMSPVSGCPSTDCTGWEGLMGVAYIKYYKHIPMYMVVICTHI